MSATDRPRPQACDDPVAVLAVLLEAMTDLALWAHGALANESVPRQYIAEYLADAVYLLANGGQPKPPPF